MPLLDVTLAAGLRPETKEELRAALCGDMAALIGIDPRFIAVLFKELPPGDMSEQGSFTEVYLSVGRPLAFKETLVKFVAEDINRVTGWPACKANVLIHDLQHGSVAAGGKILNRSGTAAEAAMKDGAK